jgi:DNA-binding NarL/FixJ family response regulator
VTLVLADQHVLFADGLRLILDVEGDLTVLALAHHASQAVRLAAQHRPAVLVLDAELPPGDPEETLATVRAASPTTRLLVLTAAPHPEPPAAPLPAGADGVVAKGQSSRQLVAAIRTLAAGQRPTVVAAGPAPVADPIVELRLQTLTPREREALSLLLLGWSNRRIAEHWRVAYLTVRSHMQSLLVKLGVHSQLAALALAAEHGGVAARRLSGETPDA